MSVDQALLERAYLRLRAKADASLLLLLDRLMDLPDDAERAQRLGEITRELKSKKD
ncbi:hypothetical protein ACSFA0_26120 [Variovorax sp. LT1P1]|uniref:hypothetical protein n=1 Tax=Variovorax sp. LT1P1 TaxID=3443730 RepID=UPI003F459B1F